MIREMIAICLPTLPANRTVDSPKHIGQLVCGLLQPEQTTHQRPRAPGCANSLFVGQHQNISRDAAGPAWSICTPLAALKTWFSPVPVNNPCRSHTHRATPRVVRQPSETVLYRELSREPRRKAGFLFAPGGLGRGLGLRSSLISRTGRSAPLLPRRSSDEVPRWGSEFRAVPGREAPRREDRTLFIASLRPEGLRQAPQVSRNPPRIGRRTDRLRLREARQSGSKSSAHSPKHTLRAACGSRAGSPGSGEVGGDSSNGLRIQLEDAETHGSHGGNA